MEFMRLIPVPFAHSLSSKFVTTSPTFVTSGKFHQCFLHSFYTHRSQKYKKDTDNLTDFFALLGFAPVKALRKMLMKLTPHGCDTIETSQAFYSRIFHTFEFLTYLFCMTTKAESWMIFSC